MDIKGFWNFTRRPTVNSDNVVIVTDGVSVLSDVDLTGITLNQGVKWDGTKLVPTDLGGTEVNDLTAAVTWANVPNANITQGSVTQHQTALSIAWSQVTGAPAFITGVAWGDLTGTLGDQTDLQSALDGKEPAFTKNTAFNKDFGSIAGTVCQGHDSRLSDARTPTSHATSHQSGGSDQVNHDSLLGFVAAEHIDWSVTGAEDVHADRIGATAVTQHEGAIDHDALLNFVQNEHATPKNSIEIDTGQLQFVNDAASPGNDKVYGTNGSGVKGWKDDPAGGGDDAVYVDYYDTGTTNITTSPTTLDLNTTRQGDAAFSMSAGTATCNTPGDYRLDYDVSLNDSSTGDTNIEYWLEKNSVEIPGTRSRTFHDAANDDNACHGMAIVSLVATDTIRIRGDVVGGSSAMTTLAESVRLVIHSIGANGTNGTDGADGADGATGATGPQGPTGSGSSISLEEGGVLVTNTPHTNVDFDAADFDVSDNGDGSATITVVANHDTLPGFVANEHATPKNSIKIDTAQLQLDGDVASPGNDKVYGTSGAGVKGWFDAPDALPPEYFEGDSTGQSTTTSTSPQTKLAVSCTGLTSGYRYAVEYSLDIGNDSDDKESWAELTVDNTVKAQVNQSGKGGTGINWWNFGGVVHFTGESGTVNVDLDYYAGADGGTVYVRNAYLQIRRVE